MFIKSFLLLSLPILAVVADQAPVNKRNPRKAMAIADFPGGYDQSVLGTVSFTAPRGGVVKVHVDMTGLPDEGGPFMYHIHENPVPVTGECLATEAHLNPYNGPADQCESQKDDSYCQVGDLSGKHGFINTTCFETTYRDPYLSLDPANPAYVVGHSINFHFANNTRFACANIVSPDGPRAKQLEVELEKLEDLGPDSLELDGVAAASFFEEHNDGDDLSSATVQKEAESESLESTQEADSSGLIPDVLNEGVFPNQTVNGSYYNGTECEDEEAGNVNSTVPVPSDICENFAISMKGAVNVILSVLALELLL